MPGARSLFIYPTKESGRKVNGYDGDVNLSIKFKNKVPIIVSSIVFKTYGGFIEMVSLINFTAKFPECASSDLLT